MDKPSTYSPSRLDSTRFFIKQLPQYLKNAKNIADIGCGRLYFYSFLKNTRFRGKYWGIDVEPAPELSKVRFKASVIHADFLKYRIEEKYDAIACLWVLEHIKSDKKAFKKISKILKKNGVFILAVPSLWSWPIELGRHGYHYYSLNSIKKLAINNDLEILENYSSSGLLGLFFMIIYSWPRYPLLILAICFYKIAKLFNLTNMSWQHFSSKLISNTLYHYHSSKTGIRIHNKIVSTIVKLDNHFKLFPTSYIFILKKI